MSIYDIDDFYNAWQESDTKRSLCECIGLPFDDFKELGNDKVNIYKKTFWTYVKDKSLLQIILNFHILSINDERREKDAKNKSKPKK